MPQIKVALIGVGNCASALVQGAHFYRDAEKEEDALGLAHLFLGNYHPKDVKFVSAFDIDARKIGKDLSEAIYAQPNNTQNLAHVPHLDVPVLKGPVLDGVAKYLKNVIEISDSPRVEVAKELEETDVEIVINLLPSGAIKASQWYAGEALKAGCAFINALPTFIASDVAWGKRFEKTGLPVVGDDLVDQVGATIIHKMLLKTLADRGVRVSKTYQLDVGGGTESLNTLERTREAKRIVKTKSVETALPYRASIVAGSTDYVDFLENRRDSYFWIKGFYFGRVPMQLDLKLSTVDAPNAGSVLLDVIRGVKIALDRGLSGPLTSLSAYAFKHPPQILPLETAEQWFMEFVDGNREQ
ncbi:MAG: inositol-3-phosphate synthase [Candidatus Bathyarchaeota archaeon]|nr:inositol-3-phosphate synthase [Candidatus Bathyarchaeota archaeon]MDH5733005.1 inositol-3-phosphate synthase [Candidatus Bathyarchaeota archaeon]